MASSTTAPIVRFGFRKRCAWCGVQLRRWQRDCCRMCHRAHGHEAGIYLQSGGPPCGRMSRIDDEPDPWKWWWQK